MVYYAFDLLCADGFDLRSAALVDRKRILADLIGESSEHPRIRLSSHLAEDGERVLSQRLPDS